MWIFPLLQSGKDGIGCVIQQVNGTALHVQNNIHFMKSKRMNHNNSSQTEKERPAKAFLSRIYKRYFSSFAHFWLATVQEVLQADWQLA